MLSNVQFTRYIVLPSSILYQVRIIHYMLFDLGTSLTPTSHPSKAIQNTLTKDHPLLTTNLIALTDAGFSGVLLLAVVVYFPSKPKIPPSVTSSCERLNFIPGVLACVRYVGGRGNWLISPWCCSSVFVEEKEIVG